MTSVSAWPHLGHSISDSKVMAGGNISLGIPTGQVTAINHHMTRHYSADTSSLLRTLAVVITPINKPIHERYKDAAAYDIADGHRYHIC